MRLRGLTLAICLLAGLLAAASVARGDEDELVLRPADTSSPRDTLRSFRDSAQEVYDIIVARKGQRWGNTREEARPAVLRMFSCLDLSQQPAYLRDSVAAESSVCLLEVFGRIDLPNLADVPGIDDPDVEDESLLKWRLPGTGITIRRVMEGRRAGEYLFSAGTVERAPEYFEQAKNLPYRPGALEGLHDWLLSEPGSPGLAWLVDHLPTWARNRYYGQAVWQWVGLVLVVVLGAAAMIGIYRFGSRRSDALKDAGGWRHLLTLVYPIAAAFVPILIRHIAQRHLVISGATLATLKFSTAVATLMTILVIILSLGNRIAGILISSPGIHPRGIDAQFIRIVARVISLTVAVIVFLEGGQYLGVPLTTLLAGAGVGGLTIALAAQDTLRNLFGSLMIMLDKPFRVGERIVAKGYDGVVEEIGLRSTRLRLLTGHEATIPNDDMARSDIENIGRRPHIRRITNIALPLDLPPEKAEQAVAILRGLLDNHEGMREEYPPRVFLNEFNRDSLNVRVMYWYHPPQYWDFMAFSERLNLAIKRELTDAGIPFALPSSSLVMSQDEDRPLRVDVSEPNDERVD